MITYQAMHQEQVGKLLEIDRSEYIDLVYEMRDGALTEIPAGHECPTWPEEAIAEIQARFLYEIQHGGLALGAFDGDRLIGFGVLAHRFRGRALNRLQIDLMFVTRDYRRQGIGRRIFGRLRDEAKSRGAEYLYISSTETRSAVSFYKSNGSALAAEVDDELFAKEPHDIHMVVKL
ncbi:GNAT family N-acetyltransferase [Paenibacillus lycopersici]|uniref:GNAT family N-acetyltransferase n=1 Tax=Paenibacillus lycopersici TaxID=2704462 RepID=A0A6C0FXA6_9BACL|nr:GNAT family N-acetyltransferase [Paenibacillus lycopersici]QHT59589.1 GNAT family N-acetyltransferase [Paenibacillus lycopersici]